MGYRPTGLMIFTNPQVVMKNSNPKGLRIRTANKPPLVPPRRRHSNQRIWDRLPEEVLVEIRKYLSPYDLVNFGMTCRSANRAVKAINPLIMSRRQHFRRLFKHLSDVARLHDGRAAFLTDADDILDDMTAGLRTCYGDTLSHRNGFYSDFECDFILSSLAGEDRMTRAMFVSDMLAVYGHTTRRCFWEEEREGPPVTPEEESFRVNRPRNGRWFKLSAQGLPGKKSTVFSRIKRKLGIPSNQIKSSRSNSIIMSPGGMSPVIMSPGMLSPSMMPPSMMSPSMMSPSMMSPAMMSPNMMSPYMMSPSPSMMSPVIMSPGMSPIMSPTMNSPSASPRSPMRTPVLSPTIGEFDEDDVKSVILRWARDKVTGVYMMSFVKVYGSGWAFEWILGSRLGEC